ncbi:hypothetical protein RHMOL_Rhmol05G0040800 [Rhododendron molle]|uniref:Uncharacterized protein n=1 Tax=Rhododendron molle TaxID=49168 RepID=A0ACC0NL82_RHOML|nr:hypothetical protein RHMOL_Rhmol05G0040800 [Rhododendron molle]
MMLPHMWRNTLVVMPSWHMVEMIRLKGFKGNPQHATRVFDMIDDFYIGDLEKI